ncbi:hypothetical protein KO507_08055 [Gilvimarinus agarilyticus]|uniref:hypothetical protein n=1 Tax=unclassified Gilvimarinus TaxID=2642066 RepID=UPI001C088FA9|nr:MULTISPECIES: hypothetical protein [unclassified Gilvimarinus]MBU2885712.1 hypothetical protein [Gilvimarinus agarilyticus]MDO6570572.1 hypothetical protein [Gilvimarinus sp. 2_MG-2023]MDO6748502.1 hypothetical protein [Gilvimarinus sp. 1_MG-2023]
MRILTAIAIVVLLLYPLLVYIGMQWLEPRILGVAIAAVYLTRLAFKVKQWWQRLMLLLGLVSFAGMIWWSNNELLLKFLPSLINLTMAAVFAYSVFYPPTIPARMAALEHPEGLPEVVVGYTLNVTWMWIGFFIINAAIAAATAVLATRATWALYNGFIAYLFMGVLLGGEFAYRQLIFRKKHAL